jgi:hypothetical protein
MGETGPEMTRHAAQQTPDMVTAMKASELDAHEELVLAEPDLRERPLSLWPELHHQTWTNERGRPVAIAIVSSWPVAPTRHADAKVCFTPSPHRER